MDTRIKKLENGDYDAILLSKAGIEALGLTNKITHEFNTEELIPCAGQGIIAIQCRDCLLYTSPSPRDLSTSRMPSSA